MILFSNLQNRKRELITKNKVEIQNRQRGRVLSTWELFAKSIILHNKNSLYN